MPAADPRTIASRHLFGSRFFHQYMSSACPKRLSPAKQTSNTTDAPMNKAGPGYRVTGAKNQTTPATPATPLRIVRSARLAGVFVDPIGSETKSYPQSQRSALSGFTISHFGHSFIPSRRYQILVLETPVRSRSNRGVRRRVRKQERTTFTFAARTGKRYNQAFRRANMIAPRGDWSRS